MKHLLKSLPLTSLFLLHGTNSLADQRNGWSKIKYNELNEALDSLIISDKVVIHINNTKSLHVSSERIFELREKARRVRLEITGLCDKNCSLLLLPIADELSLGSDAVIILNSSVIKMRIDQLSDDIFPENRSETLSMTETLSAFKKYKRNSKKVSSATFKVMQRSKNPHHLYMHSIVSSMYANNYFYNCKDEFDIGIYLTESYLKKDFYNFTTDRDFDSMRLSNLSHPNTVFVDALSFKPISPGENEKIQSIECSTRI